MRAHVKIIGQHLTDTILIIIGNLILAFGICAFITPHGIIMGGASGIGLIVKHYTSLPMSYTVYAINIVMFIIGFLYFGKKFALGTLLSTFIFPTFLAFFEQTQVLAHLTSDVLLSTIYAGICIGLGIGLVLRVGASTGGMDIPPLIASKKTGISVAILMNSFDCIILAGQLSFSTAEQILYGIMVVLITTFVMDRVMNIGETKVQVLIISPHWLEIKNMISTDIDRGCTLLSITTGYKMEESNAVMAVVSKREIHITLEMINEIDPTAFVISNDTHSVRGRGFTLPNIDL